MEKGKTFKMVTNRNIVRLSFSKFDWLQLGLFNVTGRPLDANFYLQPNLHLALFRHRQANSIDFENQASCILQSHSYIQRYDRWDGHGSFSRCFVLQTASN
jgi:hypothetical protein